MHMFNCYVPQPKPKLKVYVPCIAEVVVGDAELVAVPANDVSLRLSADLKWRSVTPLEREKEGKLVPANSSNFLRPSLEDFERVSSVLSVIDEKFSREAAREKFAQALANESGSETLTETKSE